MQYSNSKMVQKKLSKERKEICKGRCFRFCDRIYLRGGASGRLGEIVLKVFMWSRRTSSKSTFSEKWLQFTPQFLNISPSSSKIDPWIISYEGIPVTSFVDFQVLPSPPCFTAITDIVQVHSENVQIRVSSCTKYSIKIVPISNTLK